MEIRRFIPAIRSVATMCVERARTGVFLSERYEGGAVQMIVSVVQRAASWAARPWRCALPWLLLVWLATAAVWAVEAEPPLGFSVRHMDRAVSPGRNFYRYACGAWLQNAQIPEDDTSWSPTGALVRQNSDFLVRLLEAYRDPSGERSPREQQLGDFYAAAMDQERADVLGFTAIRAELERIDALTNLEELAELVAELQLRGMGGVFELSVDADERQSGVYALHVTQGGLNLPDRDYYVEKRFAKEREAYRATVAGLLEQLGRPKARIAQEVRDLLALETALAKGSKKQEDLADPIENYHKLTRAQLAELVPSLAWERYWSVVGAGSVETLIVGQPEFFKVLESQLRERSLESWKTYLRWSLLNACAPLLHQSAQKAHFRFFQKQLQGQQVPDPPSVKACRLVVHSLGESLGQVYLEKCFSPGTKARVGEMVAQLKAVLQEELRTLSWMQPETRREALEKLERFRVKIGGPETPRDYSGIIVRRDDALGNVQRAVRHQWERELKRVGKPVDLSDWEMTAHTVNAYFKLTSNEIVIPAGILKPPFFDPELDDAVNYGAIGSTIGHEMTHGYDSDGRKYDASGSLRDWWQPQDALAFEKRAQGLVEQFNRFTPLPGLRVNGRLTLSENIADLGGVRLAYLALQKVLREDPSKRRIIDGFTPEQRFFISYSQSWASVVRPKALRSFLTTDTHAPDAIRAFAPLLNLQEFYDAFHIRSDAPLYLPKSKRVSIW